MYASGDLCATDEERVLFGMCATDAQAFRKLLYAIGGSPLFPRLLKTVAQLSLAVRLAVLFPVVVPAQNKECATASCATALPMSAISAVVCYSQHKKQQNPNIGYLNNNNFSI